MHSYGVFVEIIPGYEGLVHVSELELKRVGALSVLCFSAALTIFTVGTKRGKIICCGAAD